MAKHEFKTVLTKIGSWTIAIVTIDTRKIFKSHGYMRVKGTIDGVAFKGNSLMPMTGGNHCMPIKAALRKQIKKQAGNTVTIIVERDDDEMEIPEELKEAFEVSSEAKKMFDTFTYSNKKYFIQHITEAKTQATKDKREVESILKLEKQYNQKYGN